jgi:hypothetical protein
MTYFTHILVAALEIIPAHPYRLLSVAIVGVSARRRLDLHRHGVQLVLVRD